MNFSDVIKPIFYFIYLLILGSCVSRFDPPNISSTGLLVVDGHLYIEDNTCIVRLTRTQNLNADGNPNTELNATVSIEDKFGSSFHVPEKDSSYYSISGLNLNYNTEYRIKIKTQDNKEYVSQFVSAHKSPAIDSVTFSKGNNNTRLIKVNSHDPNNNTWYYRYEYVETWEYVSGAQSTLEYVPDSGVLPRKQQIFICYKSDFSKSILVNSTKKLNVDVVNDFVLNSVATDSRKLDRIYSILVKQYAISEQEYIYWQMLQKSTETTGGILDSQPTQITGNIASESNNGDPVIGYFSAYSVAQKRATKTHDELNPDWYNLSLNCDIGLVKPFEVSSIGNNTVLLVVLVDLMTSTVIGYSSASTECADCRSQSNGGGTNIKPDFITTE